VSGTDRLARLFVAVALLVAALTAHSLALPGGTFACSCAGEPTLTGDEDAVFIGTAGGPQPDGTHAFTIERWFKGGGAATVRVASERIVFADGSTTVDTCGLHFEVGDRLILAASIGEGVLRPGTCAPHATIASPEGRDLVADATRIFGEGKSPGGEVDPEGGVEPAAGADLATVAFIAVGLAVLIAVGVTIIAVLRRGEPPEAAT
jgi:hypothetical protein